MTPGPTLLATAIAAAMLLSGMLAFAILIVAGALEGSGERVLLTKRLAAAWALLAAAGLTLFVGSQEAKTLAGHAAFGAAFFLAMAGAAYAAYVGWRRWTLVRHGEATIGEIEYIVFRDADPTSRCRVRYAFFGPDGMRRDGLSPRLRPARADALFRAHRVRVCHRRGDPNVHEVDVFGLREGDSTR